MSTYGAGYEGPDPREKPEDDTYSNTEWANADEYKRKMKALQKSNESIASSVCRIKQLADEIRALQNARVCDDPTHPIFGA